MRGRYSGKVFNGKRRPLTARIYERKGVMMRKSIKITNILRLFILLFSTIGLLFTFTYNPRVVAETYLKISPGELEFVEEFTNTYHYAYRFEYTGSGDLPQTTSYTAYTIVGDAYFQTDDDDKIFLMGVQGYFSATKLAFLFDNASKAFEKANVQSFTIPDGFTLQKSSSVTSEYAGIIFDGDMTFVKQDGTWVCEEKTTPSYTVDLSGNLSAPVWNETEGRLEATLNLPFAAMQDISYEGVLSASCEGYEGKVTATQKSSESVLRLAFNDSGSLQDCAGVCLSVSGGTLTSGEANLTLTGTETFYGYSDGSWSTEEAFEVIRIVDGESTVEKIPVTESAYTFKNLIGTAHTIFFGWEYENALYYPDDTVTVATGTKCIEIEAVFVHYGLREGASVRCDEAGLDESGIRFIAELKETGLESYQDRLRGVGVIVMPADKLVDNQAFTWENYNGNNQAKNFFVETASVTFDKEGVFQMYATIVDVLESNYNRDFIARAYALVYTSDGEQYIYNDDIQQRSVYTVAAKALTSTQYTFEAWEIKILESYVNGVANVLYADGEATLVCAAKNPVISEVSVSVVDGVVTLRLKTSIVHFPAITFNGVRIRDAVQTYDTESGCLVVTFAEEVL